ncbi:hypothetical protein E1B28_007468 [Marasmius oreades]|uniref:LYC1 C-terminal domain-containing protein n=1 Tax=Marasmius oreades TaxID=181124 RepID=A0A9P7UVT9_9AGAR|nr:uncharacterized protein E1B28_007468 [Marasmius oreades]KAG7093829.1 hypothetical protein E1B28_007468 [Marasmius oreades]
MITELSSLSLFLATPAQRLESYRRTAVAWSRGLTEAEYIQQQQEQAPTFECAKDRKWLVWVLAPREDPQTLNFKCACETYRRPGLILAPNTTTPQDVVCYGIASVFTPVAERGKGYAKHMMRLLHWVLSSPQVLLPSSFPTDRWGDPPTRVADIAGDAQISALWSDAGDLYSTCGPFGEERGAGWTIHDPESTIWDPRCIGNLTPNLEWEWLNEDTVQDLWDEDVRTIRSELTSFGPDRFNAYFTFLPSAGVETFQRDKLRFLWRKEGITQWGVRVKRQGSTDFATWTVELSGPNPRTLMLTRLRAHQDSFPIILSRAAEIAKKHDLHQIEMWNLDKSFQDLAGGKTFVRDEHLPAVRWYGNNVDLVWVHNEKFCWC